MNPNAPGFSPTLKLTGLRLRGRCLDIAVEGGQFTVTVDGQEIGSRLGVPVVLPAEA